MDEETTKRHPKTIASESLDTHKEIIVASREAGTTIDGILAALHEDGVKCGRATLYRSLRSWNCTTQRQPLNDEQI